MLEARARRQRGGRTVKGLARSVGFLAIWLATVAAGQELTLGVQVSGAMPVYQPQRSLFGIGGASQLGLGLRLLPALELRISADYLLLPGRGTGPASVLSGALAVRTQLPFTETRSVAPFLEIEGGRGRSGVEVFTAGASAGVLWRANAQWTLGLEGRFTRIFAMGALDGQDSSDASVVSAGVRLEYSLSEALRPKPKPVEPEIVRVEQPPVKVAVEAPAAPAPPAVAPPAAAAAPPAPTPAPVAVKPAAPAPKQVVVTATKLELKQKLHFESGTSTLDTSSDPLLAELERALRDHKELCVRIEGHTDQQGDPFENLELSAGRAEAVRDALVARKIDTRRLIPRGFGATAPIASNATAAGREQNRRVEFVIVPCPAPGKKASR